MLDLVRRCSVCLESDRRETALHKIAVATGLQTLKVLLTADAEGGRDRERWRRRFDRNFELQFPGHGVLLRVNRALKRSFPGPPTNLARPLIERLLFRILILFSLKRLLRIYRILAGGHLSLDQPISRVSR